MTHEWLTEVQIKNPTTDTKTHKVEMMWNPAGENDKPENSERRHIHGSI